MNAISVRGLTKRFGNVTAVDGIDLTISEGEVVAFLGPNGAGKTSTLDMILGLSSPTSGELHVLGGSPAQGIRAGRISALLQTGGLLADLKVRETVAYIAAAYPHHDDVDAILERTGLTELAHRKVGKCSGGEQQRLKFALALLPEPDILILDEPTTGMDVSARREFWRTMHEEANRGRTVIFATHYLPEAEEFADRTILMNRGRIVADGPTSEVRSIAGLRHVRADFAKPSPALTTELMNRGADGAITWEGNTLTVNTAHSDAVAKYLLDRGATNLLISESSLEDAFLALVAKGA